MAASLLPDTNQTRLQRLEQELLNHCGTNGTRILEVARANCMKAVNERGDKTLQEIEDEVFDATLKQLKEEGITL